MKELLLPRWTPNQDAIAIKVPASEMTDALQALKRRRMRETYSMVVVVVGGEDR